MYKHNSGPTSTNVMGVISRIGQVFTFWMWYKPLIKGQRGGSKSINCWVVFISRCWHFLRHNSHIFFKTLQDPNFVKHLEYVKGFYTCCVIIDFWMCKRCLPYHSSAKQTAGFWTFQPLAKDRHQSYTQHIRQVPCMQSLSLTCIITPSRDQTMRLSSLGGQTPSVIHSVESMFVGHVPVTYILPTLNWIQTKPQFCLQGCSSQEKWHNTDMQAGTSTVKLLCAQPLFVGP